MKKVTVEELDRRIREALRETPEMRQRSRFSEYTPEPASGLRTRLAAAAEAAGGGVAGIDAGLDEFDRMSADEDPLALRYALQLFVTHDGEAARLGLQVPSLEERSPWMIAPSRKDERGGD